MHANAHTYWHTEAVSCYCASSGNTNRVVFSSPPRSSKYQTKIMSNNSDVYTASASHPTCVCVCVCLILHTQACYPDLRQAKNLLALSHLHLIYTVTVREGGLTPTEIFCSEPALMLYSFSALKPQKKVSKDSQRDRFSSHEMTLRVQDVRPWRQRDMSKYWWCFIFSGGLVCIVGSGDGLSEDCLWLRSKYPQWGNHQFLFQTLSAHHIFTFIHVIFHIHLNFYLSHRKIAECCADFKHHPAWHI